MRDLPPIINGELSLSANYMVRGSAGDWKTYAYIPWVAIFDKQITTSALRGVYIVFLFFGDAKHVYLSLNQGFTFFQKKFKREKYIRIAQVARVLRDRFGGPGYINQINLQVNYNYSKGYEAGHIIGKSMT